MAGMVIMVTDKRRIGTYSCGGRQQDRERQEELGEKHRVWSCLVGID